MRILTLNIWQEQGAWPKRLLRIAEEIRSVDAAVVCLQEVRERGQAVPNQAQTLARMLGMDAYFRPADTWGGGDEGLAILSRFPVEEEAVAPLPVSPGRHGRLCIGVRLGVQGLSVWVFTTHLAYRPEDGALRERQVVRIAEFISETVGDPPAGDQTVVLTGDFNADPSTDEIRFLCGKTALGERRSYFQDAFASANGNASGHTWSASNPNTEALGWLPANRRIDYIFVSAEQPQGRARIHQCWVAANQPDAAGLWPSDHFGVAAEITP